jgi:septum formation inhibitor-activating ATPase MinD
MWPDDTPRPERNVFRMEIPREQIQNFLDDLNRMQFNYIEQALEAKARQGFPEAMAVIKHIMELK